MSLTMLGHLWRLPCEYLWFKKSLFQDGKRRNRTSLVCLYMVEAGADLFPALVLSLFVYKASQALSDSINALQALIAKSRLAFFQPMELSVRANLSCRKPWTRTSSSPTMKQMAALIIE